MKSFIKSFKSSAGFTLIELLVVIGILGILASALIATIDPFEQLKKAQDANVKNALVEYLNANVRYYTTHNTFPWDTTVNGGAACNGTAAPDGTKALTDAGLITCTTALTNEKELKSAFGTATSLLKEIYMGYNATNVELTGCFKPSSASQQKDKNTIYTDGAGTADSGNTCKANGGSALCYWCTK